MAEFARTVITSFPFDEAVHTTREMLEDEGLVVLAETDVRDQLWERTGVDAPDHVAFTVTTLPLAEATADRAPAATVLPITVAVYQDDASVKVSAVNVTDLYALAPELGLDDAADDANRRLGEVLDEMMGTTEEQVEDEHEPAPPASPDLT